MTDALGRKAATVSREELFRQVWTTPMSHLAQDYGISGNGLVKICDRLKVPYPPRGYWAKKAAGKRDVQYRLLDREDGPVPVAAGYACARSYDEAASGAVLEAAQSRLTDVHGAREDTVPMDRADAAALRHACLRARTLTRPRRRTGGEPLRALWKAGYRRAAVVELATTPLRVVKVIVPGLRVSELL